MLRFKLRARAVGLFGACIIASFSAMNDAMADEGGVSFWLPGFFGSLAATPMQPGWSLTSIYYHTSVSEGADVAKALEFRTGRISANLAGSVNASLQARADLEFLMPEYTFATPVGTVPFSRFDTISDSVTGFGDVLPLASLRWNNGVHNYMTYITGGIP